MLTLRFTRAGRRNRAFFRIVATEKSRPAKSGFNKILGWYDPKTKEASLNKEEILKLVENGAKPSNSLAKLLIAQNLTHKNIKFVPNAPGKPKKKEPTSGEAVKTEIAAEEKAETVQAENKESESKEENKEE